MMRKSISKGKVTFWFGLAAAIGIGVLYTKGNDALQEKDNMIVARSAAACQNYLKGSVPDPAASCERVTKKALAEVGMTSAGALRDFLFSKKAPYLVVSSPFEKLDNLVDSSGNSVQIAAYYDPGENVITLDIADTPEHHAGALQALRERLTDYEERGLSGIYQMSVYEWYGNFEIREVAVRAAPSVLAPSLR